jgi:hypothetical protein
MHLENDQEIFVLAKSNWYSALCEVDIGEAIGLHLNPVDFKLISKMS